MGLFKRKCRGCGGKGVRQLAYELDGIRHSANIACWDCNGGTMIKPAPWQEQRRTAWENEALNWTPQSSYLMWSVYDGRHNGLY